MKVRVGLIRSQEGTSSVAPPGWGHAGKYEREKKIGSDPSLLFLKVWNLVCRRRRKIAERGGKEKEEEELEKEDFEEE